MKSCTFYLMPLLLAASCSAPPPASDAPKTLDFQRFSDLTKRACSCEMAGHPTKKIDAMLEKEISLYNIDVIGIPSDPISVETYCTIDHKNCVVRAYRFNWSNGVDDKFLCDGSTVKQLDRHFMEMVERDKSDDAFKAAIEATRRSMRSLSKQARAKISPTNCY